MVHTTSWYVWAKPGKIRLGFDCSAEYLGYALNKQLIPGPDLTNQMVGVLIRFRQEQVALMRDNVLPSPDC